MTPVGERIANDESCHDGVAGHDKTNNETVGDPHNENDQSINNLIIIEVRKG